MDRIGEETSTEEASVAEHAVADQPGSTSPSPVSSLCGEGNFLFLAELIQQDILEEILPIPFHGVNHKN